MRFIQERLLPSNTYGCFCLCVISLKPQKDLCYKTWDQQHKLRHCQDLSVLCLVFHVIFLFSCSIFLFHLVQCLNLDSCAPHNPILVWLLNLCNQSPLLSSCFLLLLIQLPAIYNLWLNPFQQLEYQI